MIWDVIEAIAALVSHQFMKVESGKRGKAYFIENFLKPFSFNWHSLHNNLAYKKIVGKLHNYEFFALECTFLVFLATRENANIHHSRKLDCAKFWMLNWKWGWKSEFSAVTWLVLNYIEMKEKEKSKLNSRKWVDFRSKSRLLSILLYCVKSFKSDSREQWKELGTLICSVKRRA